MANVKNLKPKDSNQSREEAKINGKKGGIASGKARRERKALKEELLLLLSEGDTQKKVSLALIQEAMDGNTKAFEIIRDTIGEKPKEKIEHSGNVNNPYANLSEELKKLAGDV